jgi:FMN-dependent NADH-azoreductase
MGEEDQEENDEESEQEEVDRCKNRDWDEFSNIQKVLIATDLYNSSIHSVTKVKPADGFF